MIKTVKWWIKNCKYKHEQTNELTNKKCTNQHSGRLKFFVFFENKRNLLNRKVKQNIFKWSFLTKLMIWVFGWSENYPFIREWKSGTTFVNSKTPRSLILSYYKHFYVFKTQWWWFWSRSDFLPVLSGLNKILFD